MNERTVLDVMMDAIVNPRCDECGASVENEVPKEERLNGPHLCFLCKLRGAAELEARYQEFVSQERPDRRVHIVKLPPGMMKK